jgi:hypothetical protein
MCHNRNLKDALIVIEVQQTLQLSRNNGKNTPNGEDASHHGPSTWSHWAIIREVHGKDRNPLNRGRLGVGKSYH